MKLSKKTVELLKNFATINPNILIPPGSTLSTLSPLKSIFASVEVDEKFDKEVRIFNLNEFINVLGLFGDPDLTITDFAIVLKEGGNMMKYVFASEEILLYPKKNINITAADIEFDITADHLNAIMKAAGTLSVTDVAFACEKGKLLIKVLDKKNPSSNQYAINTGVKYKDDFIAYFKIENFKQVSDDYKVSISKKFISTFEGKNSKTKYHIAIEQDSEWS
jgi:hypothetical protein